MQYCFFFYNFKFRDFLKRIKTNEMSENEKKIKTNKKS